MRPMTPLCALAAKYQSDKGGRHLTYGGGPCHATHEYTPIYWDLLHERRNKVRSVLEIGVNRGCGLRMWEEFFPFAHIIGLDIKPECLYNEGRIRCYQADQSDPHSLRNALQAAQGFPYDVIIDDGSHELAHQRISLHALAEFLTDDGIYIIEDIPRSAERVEALALAVPHGFYWTVMYPQLAHGDGWPEQLFIVRRE